jgi:hypothetical protein
MRAGETCHYRRCVDKGEPIDLINVAFGNVHAATNATLLETLASSGMGVSGIAA